MTIILLLSSILSSAALVCWGYAAVGWIWVALGMALVGVAWLVAVWRGWGWFAWVGMTLNTLAAGFGVLLDLPLAWLLGVVVSGLVAWDLTNFHHQLRFVEREDLVQMERSHTGRLGLFLGIALLLGAGAIAFQVSLTFEWVALLVLLGIWGVSRMVKWLRKPQNKN